MKSATAIVILIFSNHDGSNIQLNGPFTSSVMTPGGKVISVDNQAVMLAARMNALKSLN
jgi:hypothetical protein